MGVRLPFRPGGSESRQVRVEEVGPGVGPSRSGYGGCFPYARVVGIGRPRFARSLPCGGWIAPEKGLGVGDSQDVRVGGGVVSDEPDLVRPVRDPGRKEISGIYMNPRHPHDALRGVEGEPFLDGDLVGGVDGPYPVQMNARGVVVLLADFHAGGG